MRSCCICKKKHSRNGISLHKFPTNEHLLSAWSSFIQSHQRKVFIYKKSSHLCNEHFQKNDFVPNKSIRTLKRNAVPTIFKRAEISSDDSITVEDSMSIDNSMSIDDSVIKIENTEDNSRQIIHVTHADTPGRICSNATYQIKIEQLENEIINLHARIKGFMRELKNCRKREKRAKDHCKTALKKLRKHEIKNRIEERKSKSENSFYKVKPYTDDQQNFAVTLQCYSSRAYNFCRNYINLPAESTIRRWMTKIDSRPGFTEQIFNELKTKSDVYEYKFCSVMIDIMAIKPHIDHDTRCNKLIGYVDCGEGVFDLNEDETATHALVIMAVGLTGHWKVTLGYFFINGITPELQAQLLKTAFVKLHQVGIRGICLVMDGHPISRKTMEELGGAFDTGNMISSFKHPANGIDNIYMIFDASHLIKLIRNLFDTYDDLKVAEIDVAKWRCFEFQNKEGLKLLHVNRAVGFEETKATEIFVGMISRLFDIFNSKNLSGKKYKAPISKDNFYEISKFLINCKQFLSNITLMNNEKLVDARKCFGIIGFVFNIDSLLDLSKELLMENNYQNYLLTHKLSQDHLKLYFSCIRLMGCNNSNPTCKQFESGYRKLSFKFQTAPSGYTDSVIQNHTNLNFINSNKNKSTCFETPQIFNAVDDMPELSFYVINICEYISGYVVRKLCEKLSCATCLEALFETDNQNVCRTSLIKMKDDGGLFFPSRSVIKIVEIIEKLLKTQMNVKMISNELWDLKMEQKLIENIPRNIFSTLDRHFIESQNYIDNHFTDLIRNICRIYTNIRKNQVIND